MQKRGQVYLLAALIIGFILFTLVAETNIVRKTIIEDDFEALSKNYERESAKFINNLLEKSSTNVGRDFLKFTVLFTSFSKTKNPEFGVIYAFLYKETLYIGNYLDTEIVIRSYSPSIPLEGCYDEVKTSISIAGLDVTLQGVNIGEFSLCTLEKQVPENKKLTIEVEDIEYTITLIEDHTDIIIVSRETKDKQRKVFVKGFKKGKAIQ